MFKANFTSDNTFNIRFMQLHGGLLPTGALWIQICQKWRNFPRLTIKEEKLPKVNLLTLAAASRALKEVFRKTRFGPFFFNQLEEVYRSQGDLLLATETSRDKNLDCYSSWHHIGMTAEIWTFFLGMFCAILSLVPTCRCMFRCAQKPF